MIIITGTIAWDYIMEFPGKFGDHILASQLHNINVSFIVNKFSKRRGGTAGNVSYTMGLLGIPHILYTTAGSDFSQYQEAFEKLGIDTSHVVTVANETTATGFDMTDKANNQIWGFYYGASTQALNLQLEKVARKGDLVLIGPQGAKVSMWFVNQCISLGTAYMFDPGFILTEISDEDLLIGVTHAAYVIGNEYEMQVIGKRVKKWKEIQQDKTIITTRGEKGAVIQAESTSYTIPAVGMPTVETTGAGDAWRGGFLAGIVHNMPLTVCGQIGSVAAGFAVGHYGTQEHFYTKENFKSVYRQTFGSLLEL